MEQRKKLLQTISNIQPLPSIKLLTALKCVIDKSNVVNFCNHKSHFYILKIFFVGQIQPHIILFSKIPVRSRKAPGISLAIKIMLAKSFIIFHLIGSEVSITYKDSLKIIQVGKAWQMTRETSMCVI